MNNQGKHQNDEQTKSKEITRRAFLKYSAGTAVCASLSPMLFGCGGGATNGEMDSESLVFVNVTVIDATGRSAQPDMTVVVTGDRITSVAATGTAELSARARVIEGRGMYLIPGLWDMHVHLGDPGGAFLPLLVAHGVTSVRDMGNDMALIRRFRREVEDGVLIGPRIKSTGSMIIGPDLWELVETLAPPSIVEREARQRSVVSTPDEARRAVRDISRSGADFVKLHDYPYAWPRETFFAVTDEARLVGLSVVGHLPNGPGPGEMTLCEVSDAGFRSIEHHDYWLTRLDALSVTARRELYARFVNNDTAFVPTLIVPTRWSEFGALPDLDSRMNFALSGGRGKFISPTIRENWRFLLSLKSDFSDPYLVYSGPYLAEMHRAGVRIMPGSDLILPAMMPGSSLHDELELLGSWVGMTPHEILQSATRHPAEFLGMQESLGTVEAGKIADLVLLEADPLEDISNIRRINSVVVNGRLLDRNMLNQLFEQAEIMARGGQPQVSTDMRH